jgi:hypothetical protein
MLPFRHAASADWTRLFQRLDAERVSRRVNERVFGLPTQDARRVSLSTDGMFLANRYAREVVKQS